MEKRTKKPAKKKAYRTPTLKLYGDFQKLTQGKGSTKSDGGGMPKTKSGTGAA